MTYKMRVYIIVAEGPSFQQVEDDLRDFDVTVMKGPEGTVVSAIIDIREDTIEKLLTICNKYGDTTVKAHQLTSE